MNVLKNCLITNSDAKILRQYCTDTSSSLYVEYRGFNTSVNLEATRVYSMYSGYVAMLTRDSTSRYSVVIRINASQALRYGNLKSVNVKFQQSVDISQQIGEADKYVIVEYLSTSVQNQYSFRLENTQMYKDDPMKILDIDNAVLLSSSPQYSESGLVDIVSEYDGGMNIPDSYTIYGPNYAKR